MNAIFIKRLFTLPLLALVFATVAGCSGSDRSSTSNFSQLIVFGDVAAFLLALLDRLGILQLLRHPDAAVVAEALAHQREFALVVAAHRDARR